jgi:hypothetical protein
LSITPFRKKAHPPRRAKKGGFQESISPKRARNGGYDMVYPPLGAFQLEAK